MNEALESMSQRLLLFKKTYFDLSGKFIDIKQNAKDEESKEKKEETKKTERKKLKPLPTFEEFMSKEKDSFTQKNSSKETKPEMLIELDIDMDAMRQMEEAKKREQEKWAEVKPIEVKPIEVKPNVEDFFADLANRE